MMYEKTLNHYVLVCGVCFGAGETRDRGMCPQCNGGGYMIDISTLKIRLAEIFDSAQKIAKEMRKNNNALNDSIIGVLEKQVKDAVENFEKNQ